MKFCALRNSPERRLKQLELSVVELLSARTSRGTPQLREKPLHSLPRSVGVLGARQLVKLKLPQQFQVIFRKHATLPTPVEKVAEESRTLDRLREAVIAGTFERVDPSETGHSAAGFPLGPGKRVAPQEPRDGKGQV